MLDPPVPTSRRRWSEAHSALFFALLHFAASWALVQYHEPWRDEAEWWLYATRTHSAAQVWEILRYSGHPWLWLGMLKLAALFSHSIEVLRVLHLAIASGAVYVLFRYSPFRFWQKLGLAFGYYLLFEYNLLARPYSTAVLLMFVSATLYERRYERPLLLALVLALAGSVSALSLFWSLALAGIWIVDFLLQRRERAAQPAKLLAAWGLLAVYLAGVIAMLVPPEDRAFTPSYVLHFDGGYLQSVLGTWLRSAVVIPHARVGFWETNVLLDLPRGWRWLVPTLGVGIFATAAGLLRRSPKLLGLFAIYSLGLLLFFYVAYFGFIRHHGFLFFGFLACAWMALRERGEAPSPALSAFLGVLLASQLYAAGLALYYDVGHPFTEAKPAAAFLKASKYRDRLFLVYPEHLTSSLQIYLERPLYMLNRDRRKPYIVWNNHTLDFATFDELYAHAREVQRREGRDALLIMNQRLPRLRKHENPPLVAKFLHGIYAREDIYIYALDDRAP